MCSEKFSDTQASSDANILALSDPIVTLQVALEKRLKGRYENKP